MSNTLDNIARHMIESPHTCGHTAVEIKLEVVNEKLEISNAPFAAIKADLHLTEERARGLQ